MAGIRKSALPVFTPGRVSTEPLVAIAGNGQLRMNGLAYKGIGSPDAVYLDFDSKTRVFKIANIPASKLPKGFPESDLFKVSKGTKGNSSYLSLAMLWQDKDAGIGYDFHASGNQVFKCELNTEKQVLSFSLPKGALTPKPTVARPRKAKAAASSTAAAAPASPDLDLGI